MKNSNNKAVIVGYLEEFGFRYSHTYRQEKMYKTTVAVPRKSGTEDYIPVFASESVLKGLNEDAAIVEVRGRFTSHDRWLRHENRHKLQLYLSAESVEEKEQINLEENNNYIYLEGEICKEPVLRTTSQSRKIRISDLIIKTYRESGRKEVIPCIAWEDLAIFISENMKIGTKVVLEGRIQSRIYYKKEQSGSWFDDYKTAYEVAIKNIKAI